MSRNLLSKIFCPALAFIVPFSLFFFTRSTSLGFSDAAEFALVTKLGSIAHGPGFPAYVFLGWLWAQVLSVLGGSHYFFIQLFSIVSAAASCVLLYFTAYNLSRRVSAEQSETYSGLVALVTALAFASGFTVWYWSNNVEVYAFHVLAFSLLVYGALQYNQTRSNSSIYITAIGLALGLSNHHLTIILFLPFLMFFAGGNMFAAVPVQEKKATKAKKEKDTSRNLIVEFITSKQFMLFAGITVGITVFFYGWMMYRAGLDMPFKFGRPDNLHRLYQHLTGAAWQNAVAAEVEGIVGMRAPYFGWLFVRQYGLFVVFIAAGVAWLIRGRRYSFLAVGVGYFLLLTAYQLRLNQVGDSDGYMLLPYYMLALYIPFGFKQFAAWKEQSLVAAGVFAVVLVVWNFPLADKRRFDLSQSQMKMLDKSAPPNSVVFVTDWVMLSTYYYHRVTENFRPDLLVLCYDVKFTEYTTLKVMYPRLYEDIKAEYEMFIAELAKKHEDQLYNTGCDIDTDVLLQKYRVLLSKVSSVTRARGGKILFDASAYVHFVNYRQITVAPYVSGYLMAYEKADTVNSFITLPFNWIDVPSVKYDPGAVNKVMDLYVMLDYSLRYYQGLGDQANYAVAEKSYDKILRLQKEMNANLPFVFTQPELQAKWK